MKRFLIIAIITICFCATSSCNRPKEDKESYVQTKDDYFLYDINEMIYSFDVDEAGNLYKLSYKDRIETGVTDDGIEYENRILDSIIQELDMDGMLINTYTLDSLADRFCLGEGCVYYIDTSNANSDNRTLAVYSFDTRESEKICDVNGYTIIVKLVYVNDKLFFMGVNSDYIGKDYKLANSEDNFNYSGERIGCIDLSTNTFNELEIDLPIAYSKTLNGNLMIYAYDEEKGYYFVELDTSVMKVKDRIYNDLEQILAFQIINEDNDFLYHKARTGASFTLAISRISNEKLDTDLIPDFPGGFNSLLYRKGYTYSQTYDNNHILRVRADYFNRSSEIITMLSPVYYDLRTPFGCGFTIKSEYMTDEEMALSMLSKDEGYDIYYMNSNEDISENIRDKGSFYPLNEVEGVKEYLDSCFPYIKDAAINEDGDIWMLPISINIPYIVYNENACKDYDMELSKSMSLDNLVNVLTKVKQDSSIEKKYNYFNNIFVNNLLHQYTREYTNFDNDIFRKLAQSLKNNFNGENSNGEFILNSLTKSKDNNMLFVASDLYNLSFINKIMNMNGLRACKFPGITDNKSNTANCYYLCVNPASKNLKRTLQYISSLCSYLLTQEDNMMLSNWDNPKKGRLIDDLYEIYSNGDVQFTYPDELFKEDLLKYFSGEKELESVIQDSNRRMDIYLNE